MAPETSADAHTSDAHSADGDSPRRRRHTGSALLLGTALVAAAVSGSLWVTGLGGGVKVAAAGTSGTSTPIATPAPTPGSVANGSGGAGGAVSAAANSAGSLATEPAGPRNLLLADEIGLDTTVTTYTDCSGQTELTHTQAAIDTCVSGRTYFVGHNVGVFTPLLAVQVGDIITYYDNSGVEHELRVVEVRDNWLRANGVPPVASSQVVAQFQTCETAYPDGSHDRIVDVVDAN